MYAMNNLSLSVCNKQFSYSFVYIDMQISYTTLRFLLRRNEKENVDASRDEKDLHHTIHRDMSKYDKSDKRYKHFQKEDMEMLDIFWRMFSCRECEFYKNYPKCHRNFGSITHIDETTTVGQLKIGEFVHEMRYTEFPPEEAIIIPLLQLLKISSLLFIIISQRRKFLHYCCNFFLPN